MSGPKIAVGSHVWARSDDPELVWIDGEVSHIQGEDATVVLTNRKTITEKVNNLEMKDMELPEKGIEDMTRLPYLHEPGVLQNVALRYFNNDIYTYVGNILIAVNPFQRVPHLIGEELMQKHKGKNLNEMPPHIFALGDVAYRAMINEQKSNSVLVSGESGAGKTEATKLLMRYLAFIGGTTGSGERTVEQKVLESNPILEAFGNAKTVRNNNSSRFGKFVEIQFNDRGKISGAAVRTYLLEKSRVCQIGSPERSYHVFYFLCAAPPEHKERFKVEHPQQFHYLNQSDCFQVDRINDYQEYMDMRNAMDIVGMNEEEQDAIFRIVAAILHLGNVNFAKGKEPDSSQIKDDQSRFHLNTAADLLRVDVAKLEKAMICKRIVTREGSIDKDLDPNSAVVSRDGLSKTIYSRLFDWLVEKINVSIGQDPKSKILIGVLDIYGFESFKTNSFEQLCINLTNEKLQQHFNQHVFKMEQEEYNREEIDWSYIEFSDNQDVLDLIEKKPGGVLALLDESCMLPRATHETFATSMYNKFKGHKRFSKPKLSRTAFTIQHFAGDVTYQSEQFLDKNKDYVVPEQNELLNESKCSFVSNLFPITEESKSAKFNSIGTRFKMQLNSLMDTLNSTEPHYVRCVKPNNLLKPMIFQNSSILQQLQCGGVLEAIRISCLGFPTRRTFAEFLKRFTVLGPSLVDGVDEKEACRKILDKYGLQRYQIGKTKVFLRAGQMAELDARRTEVLGRAATKIQRKWKTYSTRKKYLHLREVSAVIQAACRAKLARDLHESMRRLDASIKVQKFQRCYSTRKSYENLVSNTITIQTGLRAMSARLEFVVRFRNRAATRIQAKWRCHRDYMAYKRLKKATITSQSWRKRVLAKRELENLREIAKEKARLEEERRKKLEEEERERARLEAERLAAMVEEERQREIEEAARRKKLEEEERQRAAEEAERRKKLEEEEQQREAEEEERRKKLEEEERQRAAEEAERQKALEAERKKQLEEEERRRAIEEAERAKVLAEEEKRRAIEEAERQKALVEEEIRRAIEEAERQKALEAERKKALAEVMEKQGEEIDQLKTKLQEASQENELLKKELVELQEKVGEANKEIVNGLQETIRRLEEAASSTEALLQTEKQDHDATKNALAKMSAELVKQAEENNSRIKQLQEEMRRIQEDELAVMKKEHEITKKELEATLDKNKEFEKKIDSFERKVAQLEDDLERYKGIATEKEALFQTEKQEHDATRNILGKEKQDHEATKYALTKERQEHDTSQSALAKEKQEHDATKNILAKEKQEHDATKNALAKEKQVRDETEYALTKEKREHEETQSALKKSQEKVKDLQYEFQDADKKIYDLQSDLKRSKEETTSTEAMLQAEKRIHDTTKQTLIEFQQRNDFLQRKVEDSDKRIVDLQGNVQRLEQDKATKEAMLQTKETLLQTEREEHDVTRRKLSDSQEKNEELTKKFQGADQKIVELQIELKRFQEEAAAKEMMLQREKQEHKATQEELIESQAKNKKLAREVDDANDTCDRLQRNIKRLDETIVSNEILLNKEREEHDGTKKLLKESHEENEELMDKTKDANKRMDRIQENMKSLEEALSSKKAILQTEKQEHEAIKRLYKECKELNEELEDKIKDATKKWAWHQEDMKRLEETILSKEAMVQAEQIEHDTTKKSLKQSKEKIDDLTEKVRDANKRFDRLQDDVERLKEAKAFKQKELQEKQQEFDLQKKFLTEYLNKIEELEKKNKDSNKRFEELQGELQRLEEIIASKETLLQTEQQDHDATKNFVKKLKEQNDDLLDKIRVNKKIYDQLQDDVERLQEARASKETLLKMKEQELDTTKSLLIQSHGNIEDLKKKLKDANIIYDKLQEDIKRFEETIASKEILIQAERQKHEDTKKLLKESHEKNEEFMDKIKEANKRTDRIQEHVERLEETLSSKESLLQVEKEEHQETKKLIKKYKEQIEDLEEKLKDANRKLDRHQDIVERLEEAISLKETTLRDERQEHEQTKKLLKDLKDQNYELTEQVQITNKRADRLQSDLERLQEAKLSKDTLLQKKQQELDTTKSLLTESLEKIDKLDGKIKDGNKRFDDLQSEIKRLEENILLKEILLQTERQEHDGTKKLLRESRDKNEDIMDRMKEVDKRSDRLQDDIKRLEESISLKESSLQTERQEHEETKKNHKKLREQNEELEEKIKEANKKIDRYQGTIERLEETIASKEALVQSERQEHDTTKKLLRETKLKVEDLSETVRDADKKYDRLQDKIERLEEAINSKDTMLQNERRENDATKKLLKESQQECEDLEKKIRDAQKKIDRLQDNVERFEETVSSKDSLLQKERQEHEVTKKSIKALQDDNGALVQKNEEANKLIDRLQEDIKRFEEYKASTEVILQTERQGHDVAKILLTEARKKTEELEKTNKDFTDRIVELQEDVKRLEDSLAAKDDTLQTERQEHDVTRKSLKRSQDEYKELMKQIEEDRERITELQNNLQRYKESEVGKETQLLTEKREHDMTKRELSETKEKIKDLLQKAESTDERVGHLQLELKRLGEEIIAKDASVQIEKREHEATQRALAQAKEYGEELLKRNETSSSRIDKLQEDIASFEEKAKEMQEQMLKGKLEIYDARKQVADAELRNKELLQKFQLSDKKISQLQDTLERFEENAKQREIMLQTEKQQHEKTKSSLSSANGKIQQLEKQIVQYKEGVKRFEQDVIAKIQSERQQHDGTKRALSDSQRKNQELQQKVQFSESTIEQLRETNRRLEEKTFTLEQENNSIRQTGAKLPPTLRRMGSQRMSESFNGYNAPESPYNAPRAPMSTTPRGDFYSEDDREQNAFNEQQQQENRELLIRSISQHLGFVNGAPVAANLIYKCLVSWKSFEADRTGVFDLLIQKINSFIEDQDNNESLAYWISNLSTLVPLLQKIHRASGGPVGPTPVRRRRMSRTSSSMSGFGSNFGVAAGIGANFIQQLIMLLEKLLTTMRDNLKNELSSLLNLSIQAPKVSRMSSMKGLGQALGSSTGQWHSIVRILDNYLIVLKSNYVPPYIIQRFFIELFQIMDSQLFNSLLLRRESCSFINGEFLKAGLGELETWCHGSTEEYVGTAAWKELRHIRQAVDFLVALQKQRKTRTEISNDICPSLTTQQLQRLSTLYWDDKYGTNVLSQQVTAEINQMMSREPNSTFMLTEVSSPPLTLDELSRSVIAYEMRDSDLPISIRNHPGFAFLHQRNY